MSQSETLAMGGVEYTRHCMVTNGILYEYNVFVIPTERLKFTYQIINVTTRLLVTVESTDMHNRVENPTHRATLWHGKDVNHPNSVVIDKLAKHETHNFHWYTRTTCEG